MRRLVITGCGRSGTQYMANVLVNAGFRCCHERILNHDLDPNDPDFEEMDRRWKKYDIEVSWLAAPFLKYLPANTVVWQQVRDPIKVLQCWVHHKLLTIDDHAGRFVWKVLPECRHGSDLERAVQYLYRWNQMIELEIDRFTYSAFNRVEDISTDRLVKLLGKLDIPFDEERLSRIVEQTSRAIGSCGSSYHNDKSYIGWDQVLKVKDGEALLQMAYRYGYGGV